MLPETRGLTSVGTWRLMASGGKWSERSSASPAPLFLSPGLTMVCWTDGRQLLQGKTLSFVGSNLWQQPLHTELLLSRGPEHACVYSFSPSFNICLLKSYLVLGATQRDVLCSFLQKEILMFGLPTVKRWGGSRNWFTWKNLKFCSTVLYSSFFHSIRSWAFLHFNSLRLCT